MKRKSSSQTFNIGERLLSPEADPYFVAEIGVNHNGDLELAKKTIDAAVSAGADAVKFQTFKSEEFMSDKDLQYEYVSADKNVKESMYEMFKRLELKKNWHFELRDYSKDKGVEFLSSAADPLSADLLSELPVPVIKLASEDLINYPLLEHVGKLKVPLVLSTGMADEKEIDRAIKLLKQSDTSSLLLLHCVSLYPTPDKCANLKRITTLKEKYQIPVGYSDHTVGIEAALGAVSLGALFIEKHFTYDRNLPGPDHSLSSDPAEFADLVKAVKKLKKQLGKGDIQPCPEEIDARQSFRRSIVAAIDVPAETVLTKEMLALKRPATGLHPSELNKLIGKKTKLSLRKDDSLSWKSVYK